MASIGKVQACAFFREYQDSQGTWQSEVHEFRAVSQDSEFSHEMGSVEGTDGAPYYSGDETTLNLMVFDNHAGAEIMKDAYRNREKYKFVLIGYDDHIFIYDELPVQVRKHRSFAPREFNYYELSMSKSGGFHGVSSGKNILTAANEAQNKLARGWYDADNNGKADGFTIGFGADSSTFDNNTLIQTFDGNGGADENVRIKVPLPIGSLKVLGSLYPTQIHSDHDSLSRIRFIDYDDNTLSEVEENITAVGARYSLQSITSDPATYFVEWRLLQISAQSSTTSQTIGVKNPALRADGSSEWTP